jgi:hypothetical protein
MVLSHCVTNTAGATACRRTGKQMDDDAFSPAAGYMRDAVALSAIKSLRPLF